MITQQDLDDAIGVLSGWRVELDTAREAIENCVARRATLDLLSQLGEEFMSAAVEAEFDKIGRDLRDAWDRVRVATLCIALHEQKVRELEVATRA